MNDDKTVKVIVLIIVLVILCFAGIVIFLLVKKYNIDNRVEETTAPLQLTKITCNKINNEDYRKYHEFTLYYNYGNLYKLDFLYQYSFNYSFEKDKVRNDLKSILNKEVAKYEHGITGKYEPTKEGGNTSLSYDLKEDSVRIYVNSEFFHYNMYLKPNELAQYLKDNDGYNCAVDLTIQ